MVKHSYSKWPGAWERHLVRRHTHPQFFAARTTPSVQDIIEAQTRDQQELAQFHQSLQSLIERTTALTEDTSVDTITSVKKDLESCHDTSFGLAAELADQKSAITALNEVLSTAMRRSLNGKDEPNRMRLIQNDARRINQLSRLEYPIVCDLLRSISPIPQGELTAALLSETEASYVAALEVLSIDRKEYLAARIDTIIESLSSEQHQNRAIRRRKLLLKHLPDLPITNKEPVTG